MFRLKILFKVTVLTYELLIIFSLDVFISHCWDNKEHVTIIKKFLEDKGFLCWIDDKQMHGGMELLAEISEAIRESKV